MDTIIKKASSVLLALLTLSSLFIPAYSEIDFENDNRDWDTICSIRESYVEHESECQDYANYLREQRDAMDKNLADLKKDITSISGSIENDEKLLREATIEIEALNDEIDAYKLEIVSLERRIVALNDQIDARQVVIDEKMETARNYMVNIQSTTRVNAFVDFIFGAQDFAEVSRRMEGMNLINEKNQDNIRILNEEKAKLEEDKLDLEFQRKSVNDLIDRQKERVAYQEELRAYAQERIVVLRREYQALLNARSAAEEERKLAVQKIEQIGPVETSRGGLLIPVQGSFYVSGRPWAYAGGGKHLGLDLAARVGSTLVAPANGIVIATNSSCPTYGSLSSTCGQSYGNYVVMIVSSDNVTYGVLYAHLQQGGVTVGVNQNINKGQVVGRVGSSGSSTGPHLHVELFYLGTVSVQEAYDNWHNGPRNIQFGLGGSSSSSEYGNRCEVKGQYPNCRMNPASYWGV